MGVKTSVASFHEINKQPNLQKTEKKEKERVKDDGRMDNQTPKTSITMKDREAT